MSYELQMVRRTRRSAWLQQTIIVCKVDLQTGWWQISASIRGLPVLGKDFQYGIVGSLSEWIRNKIKYGDQCSIVIIF